MFQNTLLASFVILSFYKTTISLYLSTYMLVLIISFRMKYSWLVI